jgi:hypothetical protein
MFSLVARQRDGFISRIERGRKEAMHGRIIRFRVPCSGFLVPGSLFRFE